jgi:hypothetical protein
MCLCPFAERLDFVYQRPPGLKPGALPLSYLGTICSTPLNTGLKYWTPNPPLGSALNGRTSVVRR